MSDRMQEFSNIETTSSERIRYMILCNYLNIEE